jgi:dihydrofolate synthase/folylpolyglutamate synthase
MTAIQTAYPEILAWLYGLQKFGIKLGLENMRRLISELDVAPAARQLDPGRMQVPRSPRLIHVAGTNGKGSVCAMVDAICRAQGLRSGLFISPHLVTFRERIQTNGRLISEHDAALGLSEIRRLIAYWNPHPTFFEVATALALWQFAHEKLDVIILETGLGGRLDATNAVPSDVSVITPIDLDHQNWLGDTIRQIASEKAGIIKPRTPVVSSAQRPEAEEVIQARALECEAPIEFVTEPYDRSPLSLRGNHQKYNAGVAVAAVRAANLDVTDAAIARGLMSVQWPARFQRWDERTIIDGAHNPAAAAVLASTWRDIFGQQRATILLAVLADKDVAGICQALAPIAQEFILPPIRSERAMAPERLAETLSSSTPTLRYSITPSLPEAIAVARAGSSPILIAGSLHFAGEVLAFLQHRPAAFEECNQ